MSVEINVTNEVVEINEVSEIVEINVTGGIGPAGAGVPAGGTTGQILAKNSNTNYDTVWSNINAIPYVGATTNVDLGEFELKAGQVEFDQTPTGTAGVGVMRWNDTDGTVDLGLKGGNVTLQVGQEQVLRVVNKTGADLLESQYRAVRIRLVSEGGAQGQRLAVVLAQGDNDPDSTTTIGIVTETITNNQEGFITTSGEVRGINTTGSLQGETWADGDILYLSPSVAGGITKVKPTAPDHSLQLGYVVYAHINNGKIFVKVDNGYEIGELHDVYVPTPSNNDGIFWNTANLRYQNNSISGILGYTPQAALTLTTTGTSGAATLTGATLNIPQYSGTNIYNADGTLTGARTLTHGGFNLSLVGSTHTNRFTSAGRLLLGTTTEGTYLLDVNGTARLNGVVSFTAGSGATNASIYGNSTSGLVLIAGVGSTTDLLITTRGGGTAISIDNTNGLLLSQCKIANIQIGGSGIPATSLSLNATIGLTISGYSAATNFHVALVPSGGTNGLFVDSSARIKIGGFADTFNSSAILDIVSTNKGFLPPRMTTTQRDAIASPATGLQVYNTTTATFDYYNNLSWVSLQTALTNPVTGTGIAGQVAYWNGTNTQAGTNNLFWDATNGRLGIGTNAPSNKIHISDGITPAASLTDATYDFYLSKNTSNANLNLTIASSTALQRAVISGIRAKGTLAIPTAVEAADNIFTLLSGAFDGTVIQRSAGIFFDAESAASAGSAPQQINFLTGTTGANRSTKLQVRSNGNVLIQNGGTFTDGGQRLQVQGTTLLNGAVAVQDTLTFANNKGFVLNAGGTNRQTGFIPLNLLDNISGFQLYPSSGTNVGSSFLVVPKGTGLNATLKSQISVFNTDLVADAVNYELAVFRAGGTNYSLSTGKSGTGITRPLLLSAGFATDAVTNANQLWLYTSGNVGINSTSDTSEKLQVNGTMKVTGASTFGGNMALTLNQNTPTSFTINNTNSGTSTVSVFSANTSSGNGEYGKRNSTASIYKILLGGDTYLYNSTTAGDIAILNDFATGSIKMAAGGSSTAHMTIKSNGRINMSSLPTSATGLSAGDLWNDAGTLKIV